MSVELIVAALIVAYLVIAALGHVLVVTAIYKCLREDHARGRRRKPAGGTTTADDRVKGGRRFAVMARSGDRHSGEFDPQQT